MLDANSLFRDNSVEFTFFEPYPEARLNNIVKPEDKPALYAKEVQQIWSSVFEQSDASDTMFIDSTNISKIGSDVNYFYLEVLPKLISGVIIDIHEIFRLSEYPEEWIVELYRGWNVVYLLRAFSLYINHFKMILFNFYMKFFNEEW